MKRIVITSLLFVSYLCVMLPGLAANSIEKNFEIVESYLRNPETRDKDAALRALDEIHEYISMNQVTINASMLSNTEYSGTADYIMNTNTKKFHYPSCKHVDRIQQTNRQEFSGSRDELIKAGYSPCGVCNP